METALTVPHIERSLKPLQALLVPGAEIKPKEVTKCMLEFLQPLIDGVTNWATYADAATTSRFWGTVLAMMAGVLAWAGLKSRE